MKSQNFSNALEGQLVHKCGMMRFKMGESEHMYQVYFFTHAKRFLKTLSVTVAVFATPLIALLALVLTSASVESCLRSPLSGQVICNAELRASVDESERTAVLTKNYSFASQGLFLFLCLWVAFSVLSLVLMSVKERMDAERRAKDHVDVATVLQQALEQKEKEEKEEAEAAAENADDNKDGEKEGEEKKDGDAGEAGEDGEEEK